VDRSLARLPDGARRALDRRHGERAIRFAGRHRVVLSLLGVYLLVRLLLIVLAR